MNSSAEPMVPMRSASSGGRLTDMRTSTIPRMEQISPNEESANGRNIRVSRSPPSGVSNSIAMVEAIATVAIIEPQ